jgi:prolyl-tRNA synthetase
MYVVLDIFEDGYNSHYPTARKYRDERRPRHGLLRSREFIMKDLYTFDCTSALALKTYHQVRASYSRIFDELKLPYLVAEADSGDIGGDLSHEFHFPTPKGEDHIISCTKCDYVANEELAESPMPKEITTNETPDQIASSIKVWRGISQDRLTLINVWYTSCQAASNTSVEDLTLSEVNPRAVKAILPELDPSVDEPLSFWVDASITTPGNPPSPRRLVNLLDHSLSSSAKAHIRSNGGHVELIPASIKNTISVDKIETVYEDSFNQESLNLLRIKDGDACPRCPDGILQVQKAIELGHTFHLGTRYSQPLAANVKVPLEVMVGAEEAKISGKDDSQSMSEVAMQMGCHGIGVSRMIGAVADTLADEKGLNWPRVIAPFEIVIVAGKGLDEAALDVYDTLQRGELDIILDDRSASFPWKMQDADLIGYPIIVVVGRSWKSEKKCEVQCRRLNVRQQVSFAELPAMVKSLLEKL